MEFAAKPANCLVTDLDIDFHYIIFINNGTEVTEINEFNTHFIKESGQGFLSATHVTYLHLIIMNFSDPDRALTTMYRF